MSAEPTSTPVPPSDVPADTTTTAEAEGSPKAIPSSTELTPAPPEEQPLTTTSTEQQPEQETGEQSNEPQIDPELMDLPAPPHHNSNSNINPNQDSNGSGLEIQHTTGEKEYTTMGIRDSILSAPNPRPAEFPPPDQLQNNENLLLLDLDAIAQLAAENDDMPGSPTAKMMRAIAPPTAIMTNPEWPPPPPNASVNLFIGRALLSNGNDNWPLKPNDIVNWIRKHYPAEWDGDEGRCSAHRVRTYLARKGADMYYEKLNQGCINGWRIRANHLWRFDNGGFQGRGMKQEESIANAAKEQEALANAARKEAAKAALAAGHPNVKVSMSNPGINDGSLPIFKKPRISTPIQPIIQNKTTSQSRKRNNKKSTLQQQQQQQIDNSLTTYNQNNTGDLSILSNDQSYYQQPQSQQQQNPNELYSHLTQSQSQSQSQSQTQAGPSSLPILDTNQDQSNMINPQLDPSLSDINTVGGIEDDNNVDINMVQQAMQAAATQMDDLEMGIQLPIEMQMHSNGHDTNDDDNRFNFVVNVGDVNQNGQTFDGQGNYGYTG